MSDSPRTLTASPPPASPYRWYVLGLLILCYGAYGLDRTITAVVIEPIKAEFGLSDFQISALTGLTLSIPFALACIPLGMIADRVNRKWFLLVLLVGWSVMTGAAGLVTSIFALFAARVAVGAFESGFTPNGMSILSDVFPPQQRSTALGLFSLGGPVGIFCGLAVGGFVAAEHGWRAAFLIAGLPGVVLAIIVALTLIEPSRGTLDGLAERPVPASILAVVGNIWRDRALFYVVAGLACCVVLLVTVSTWIPSILIRLYGLDLRAAGLAAAIIAGVFGGAGAAAGGVLSDICAKSAPWRRLLPAIWGALVAIAAGVGALFIAPTVGAAIVLLAICAFSIQLVMGPSYGAVASMTNPSMRASSFAILLVVMNVGSQAVGSLLVGLISDWTTPWAGSQSLAYGVSATFIPTLLGATLFWKSQSIVKARARRLTPN